MNTIPAQSVAAVDYDRYARLYVAARTGDRIAQRTLIEELTEPLWRVARRAGVDPESAADVVQTAWLRLWRTKDGLEKPRALTKWLYTTVSREAWNVARRERREVASDPLDIKEPIVEGIEDGFVRDDEREAVRRAFLAQDEKCRALLAYVAAFPRPDYDVISEELGMKRGSIGPTRGRCLDKMRKTLLDDPSWGAGEERYADGT
ncbi:RNA polymerase sigma factor [Glycomyces artemisiae]|uniref:RNA polymerase sigma factor (Sigma-70 family) n=1 Tax=Glycomyces artemisiae TaxID=1076443 RepID=A0A2T0ULW9_9ACTN|nr:sigma-70 family RNA polymerase sigma factor [Glycomyces artemisiae]PRY58848.1 RNA polymerase sigma factor (sigma-70 family) [Glycomyces artemisiae]